MRAEAELPCQLETEKRTAKEQPNNIDCPFIILRNLITLFYTVQTINLQFKFQL